MSYLTYSSSIISRWVCSTQFQRRLQCVDTFPDTPLFPFVLFIIFIMWDQLDTRPTVSKPREIQLKLTQNASEAAFAHTLQDNPAFCYYATTSPVHLPAAHRSLYSYSFIKGMKMSQLIYKAIPRVWVWLHCVAWKPNVRQAAVVKCNLYL